jgi:hypothetical protein
MFITSDLVINSTNPAGENVFRIHPTNVIDKNLRDILVPDEWKEQSLRTFFLTLYSILIGSSSVSRRRTSRRRSTSRAGSRRRRSSSR